MTKVITFDGRPESIGPTVAALGVFDGVHRGHQRLLSDVVRRGRRLGHPAAALTFDRDPDLVLTPATAAPQLLTLEDKLRFMSGTGLDVILVVPFTRSVAGLSPDSFLDDLVRPTLDPVELHVGSDFRFGARAAGDVETLYVWAAENGVDVSPHELVQSSGEPITSTRVREAVAAGDMETAEGLLGRAHRVSGTVKHGRGEGRRLGVSTANVEPVEHAALPADGAYAGRAHTADGPWPSAISVGVPPSFPQASDVLEAHLIGYDGDLYDTPITLEFFSRLRPNRAFPSATELVAAIRTDVAETLRISGERVDAARAASGEDGTLPDGTPVVTDPEALETAEIVAASGSLARDHADVPAEARWVEVSSVMDFTGLPTDQGNILGLIALAELVFTPRRLTVFAERSLRTFRRQRNDLAEIGEELAMAGLEVFRRSPAPKANPKQSPPRQ